jgi:hypothetical protein
LDKLQANQQEGEEDDIFNLLRGGEATKTNTLASLTGLPGLNSGGNIDEEWELEKQKLLDQMNYHQIEIERLLQPQNNDEH